MKALGATQTTWIQLGQNLTNFGCTCGCGCFSSFELKADLQQSQSMLLQEKELLQQQVREVHSQPDFGSVKLDMLNRFDFHRANGTP